MHVNVSTHRKGHTLDVLLIRCTDEHLVRNVAITDMGISDHSAIKFTISAVRCRAALTKIKYRKLRAINADILRRGIPVFRPEDLESLSVGRICWICAIRRWVRNLQIFEYPRIAQLSEICRLCRSSNCTQHV